MTDSVEKVGASTRSNFSSAVGAAFRGGRGGTHHPSLTQRSEFYIDLRWQLASIGDVTGSLADLQRRWTCDFFNRIGPSRPILRCTRTGAFGGKAGVPRHPSA